MDLKYLQQTIDIASEALKKGNFPIGSILVNSDGTILSACSNENTSNNDITAHAEVQCLRHAGMKKLSKSNGSTILYSSLEPCGGCAFFIARTNVKKIISLADDPFRPGISYLLSNETYVDTFKNIQYEVVKNELSVRSLDLMKQYFQNKNLLDKAIIFEKAMKR